MLRRSGRSLVASGIEQGARLQSFAAASFGDGFGGRGKRRALVARV